MSTTGSHTVGAGDIIKRSSIRLGAGRPSDGLWQDATATMSWRSFEDFVIF